MLDSATRKRIDRLRDILVGKVPDPKSQVEQITTGLIYKFMYDMDREFVETGVGAPSFFAGDYEKYSWDKLFDPKLTGGGRVELYADAVEAMYTNPTAPPLFREIFKNAFLPFKDPSTLGMFLKEIDEFHYSHSEKLGDAFEYLLSFMGSQGDAGQFRTPRHIIDFIVEIVDPRKYETVLDPACGTAGFLIASYKHILARNTDKRPGDKLSADEGKALGGNLAGYDISPDMTRLSLVNMYLHRFASPRIHEYDTLSSEDRWNEHYDVILANPPFFSPKGGIKPHSRFGVSSTRAEVLFVDYIMEHLKPKGRAGVVVPEGIIFQTGTAYKLLRRKLVETCLAGVISLPAGVFQPYSGVKTSILILDKELNAKSDEIFFAKVENDGFSLGANRNPIKENDLPSILEAIKSYGEGQPCKLHFEQKNVVLENKDLSLNASSYQVTGSVHSNFPIVKLGDENLFKVVSGGTPRSSEETYWNGEVNWISLVDLPQENFITDIHSSERTITKAGLKNSSAKMIPVNSIVVSTRATIGRVGINRIPLATNQGFKNVVVRDANKVSPEFLAFMVTNLKDTMVALATGGTFKEISKTNFEELSVPLPPIEVQQEIVDELEGYQKVIDGCRQVVESYKPVIDIDPSWEMVELGDVLTTMSGGTPRKANSEYYLNGTIPWMKSGEVDQGFIYEIDEKITVEGLNNSSAKMFPVGTVCIAMYGATAGKVGILKIESSTNQAVCGILPSETYVPEFLYYFLKSKTEYFIKQSVGGAQPNISQTIVKKTAIPELSREKQEELVRSLEQERQIIDGNKKLIEIYTRKIRDRIAKVWGERGDGESAAH